MSEDAGLFGDDEPGPVDVPPPADVIADWQVTQVRAALGGTGLVAMDERQRLVEELVGRPVGSLRELSGREARALLEALAARRPGSGAARSSWDDRAEDTWIDRI